MKQALIRKLHLAGGEGLDSRYGFDSHWNHSHPLRRAWYRSSATRGSIKQTDREKVRHP